MTPAIPLIELPGEADLAAGRVDPALLADLDSALQTSGFLLLSGHGIPQALADGLRAQALTFFRAPAEAKQPLRAPVGGRGWIAYGDEANAGAEGIETPPDRKESYTIGAQTPTGDPALDAVWFPPNVYPSALPELQADAERWTGLAKAAADRLLALMALALGEPADLFTRHTDRSSWGLNLNWYPALEAGHPSLPGQYRIGAHTDFGTVTLLDRQTGRGGLQVDLPGTGWVDVPYVPGALTINVGDLLARWTGDRWRSTRHRVLMPPSEVPTEELVSLVFFYETNVGTHVETLPPPLSTRQYPPVSSHDFLADKMAAITVPTATPAPPTPAGAS